jgi:hypothetical protein
MESGGVGGNAGTTTTKTDGGVDAGGGTANTCVSGSVPKDSVRLALDFLGAVDNYLMTPVPSSVKGKVFVERFESQTTDFGDGPVSKLTFLLVDETGQRMRLSAMAPSLSFASVQLGTQFWLDAYAIVQRANPFAYHRSMRFSLRTEENGPVVFASLLGTKEGGDVLLGVPLSFQSRCIATLASPYGGISRTSGKACQQSAELFDAVLEIAEPLRISPGTTVPLTLNENPYDLTLWSASYVTFPDVGCTPADWAPSVELALDVTAKNWQTLIAAQPVFPEQLPSCRTATDTRLFTLDSQLEWDNVSLGNAEYAVQIADSSASSLTFSSPTYGSVTLREISEASRPILARGRWVSLIDYQNIVIRENEGGSPVAVSLSGTVSELNDLMSRVDILGLSVAIEPRCDWMSDVCSTGGGKGAMSLYDVIYSDSDSHRITSDGRTTVEVNGRTFDVWFSIEPSCKTDPVANATFVARS